ncbi:Oidioi.mRNA.OKI2018_I69.chr2.g4152.t1.cds [Oikopleura dioica]|uniref:Oidioi.mRNA.OKI2018_I69.chr2.g4152.t1.cds n=1 Tax=Oikopleura dioica TaxID=34765 RepID=A0ABN7T0N0_OIKDI|nr:Oidioi.mRNA.OKI2018_I69.chr2.g4152.t1.cds [Oikopleura dioica]
MQNFLKVIMTKMDMMKIDVSAKMDLSKKMTMSRFLIATREILFALKNLVRLKTNVTRLKLVKCAKDLHFAFVKNISFVLIYRLKKVRLNNADVHLVFI